MIDVVGRSTVFVEIQRVMSDRGLPKALDKKESGEESGKRKWNACEDPWCMYCYGRGTMNAPIAKTVPFGAQGPRWWVGTL